MTRAERRDHNEAEIIAALREVGCIVWQCGGLMGYDLLVCHRTGNYFIEVKMPDRRDKLTPNERAKKALIESVGGKYHIVTSVDEALQVVGGG